MTGRRRASLAAILGGVPLLLGIATVQTASAHGAFANPTSRVYACFLENPEHPVSAATSRPFWRAMTTSSSRSIGTRISAGMAQAPARGIAQIVEALLEIERGGYAVEREP